MHIENTQMPDLTIVRFRGPVVHLWRVRRPRTSKRTYVIIIWARVFWHVLNKTVIINTHYIRSVLSVCERMVGIFVCGVRKVCAFAVQVCILWCLYCIDFQWYEWAVDNDKRRSYIIEFFYLINNSTFSQKMTVLCRVVTSVICM